MKEYSKEVEEKLKRKRRREAKGGDEEVRKRGRKGRRWVGRNVRRRAEIE